MKVRDGFKKYHHKDTPPLMPQVVVLLMRKKPEGLTWAYATYPDKLRVKMKAVRTVVAGPEYSASKLTRWTLSS